MSKNIVIFSDGTGQEGGLGTNTNVYELFNMIEDRTPRQISFYDPGLGTDRSKLGQISGRGITRNIHECYQFLSDTFAAGDRIFLFGFSRGATTVRTLSSFIHLFGVLPRSRPELIRRAWRIYQIGDRAKRDRKAKEFVRNNHTMWTRIRFLGVWDTVAALGLPIKTIDVIIDKVPFWHHSFHDLRLADGVEYARHALAIDDERLTFHPQIWEEKEEPPGPTRLETEIEGFTLEDIEDIYLVAEKLKDSQHPVTQRLQFKFSEEPLWKLLKSFRSPWRRESDSKIEALERAVVRCFNTAVYKIDESLFEGSGVKDFHGITLSKKTSELMARFDERDRGSAQKLDQLLLEDAYSLRPGDRPRVKQVWFAGMHTDVGGGYREYELAHVPLLWMVREAVAAGVRIYPGHHVELRPDPTGAMHDSRQGLGRLYRRRQRRWNPDQHRGRDPLVHESVVKRNDRDPSYEPWVLKTGYQLEPWPDRLAASIQFDEHHIWREAFWGWHSAFTVPWLAVERITWAKGDLPRSQRTLTLHLRKGYESYGRGGKRGEVVISGCLPDDLSALESELEKCLRPHEPGGSRESPPDERFGEQEEGLREVVAELTEEVARLKRVISGRPARPQAPGRLSQRAGSAQDRPAGGDGSESDRREP